MNRSATAEVHRLANLRDFTPLDEIIGLVRLISVLASCTERSIIQERVRAGLRRAVAEGKQLEARILAALKAPGRT
jgi:hypothetical protein